MAEMNSIAFLEYIQEGFFSRKTAFNLQKSLPTFKIFRKLLMYVLKFSSEGMSSR